VVDAVVAFGALIQLGGYTMLAHSAWCRAANECNNPLFRRRSAVFFS